MNSQYDSNSTVIIDDSGVARNVSTIVLSAPGGEEIIQYPFQNLGDKDASNEAVKVLSVPQVFFF